MSRTTRTRAQLRRHALVLVIGSGSGLALVAMLVLARDAPELLAAYGTSTALATVLGLVVVDRGAQLQLEPQTRLRPFVLRRAATTPLVVGLTVAYGAVTHISVGMSAVAAVVVGATTLRDIALLRLASTAVWALIASAITKGIVAAGLGLALLAGAATGPLAVAALLSSPVIDLGLILLAVARPADQQGAARSDAADRPRRGREYALAPAVGAAIINVDLLLAPQILSAPAAALYVFWNRVGAALQLPSDAAARKVLARVTPVDAPHLKLAVGTAMATALGLAITTLATGHDLGGEHLGAILLLAAAAGLRSGNMFVGAVLTRLGRQHLRFAAMTATLLAAAVFSGSLLPLLGIAGGAAARVGTEAVLATRYRRAAA